MHPCGDVSDARHTRKLWMRAVRLVIDVRLIPSHELNAMDIGTDAPAGTELSP